MLSKYLKPFNLIELVVVISIFLILFTLVQPVHSKFLSHSQNAECRFKLKQVGTIVMLYTEDHNDQLPGPCTGRIFPWERTNSMLQYVAAYPESEPFIQNPYFPPNARLSQRYRTYRQFMCPSNMLQTDNDGNNENNYFSRRVSYFTGNKYGTFRGTTYENHAYINYFGDADVYDPISGVKVREAVAPVKLMEVPSPSFKVLAYDYDIPEATPSSYYSVAPIHSATGGRNVLLFDLGMVTQNSFTLEVYD